jgi:hypothetical protein
MRSIMENADVGSEPGTQQPSSNVMRYVPDRTNVEEIRNMLQGWVFDIVMYKVTLVKPRTAVKPKPKLLDAISSCAETNWIYS